jgi:hypothetical protein
MATFSTLHATTTADLSYQARDRDREKSSSSNRPRVINTYQSEEDPVSQQRWEAEREQREQQRSKNKLIHFIVP